jgi:hypothetical protein
VGEQRLSDLAFSAFFRHSGFVIRHLNIARARKDNCGMLRSLRFAHTAAKS